MSSLTIDQLKKSLSSKGVVLPPSGSKKSEYVKLYEEHLAVNESLADTFSSDDENTPLSGRMNVSSSSSPSKLENVAREVDALSDDELYEKLQAFGIKSGPVVVNTRSVYQKKLIKAISAGLQGNGLDTTNGERKVEKVQSEEFSDSDVEVPVKAVNKRVSVTRELSKDKASMSSHNDAKASSRHSFASQFDDSVAHSSDYKWAESKPTKFSFIETIQKGTNERIIEPSIDLDRYNSPMFRSRFANEGKTTPYKGSWSPDIHKYSKPNNVSAKTQTGSPLTRSLLLAAGLAVLGGAAFYLYQLWLANDPYKLIETDAEYIALADKN